MCIIKNTFANALMHVHICLCTCIFTHTYTLCMHMHTYICMHTCMHTHANTHAHIHIMMSNFGIHITRLGFGIAIVDQSTYDAYMFVLIQSSHPKVFISQF